LADPLTFLPPLLASFFVAVALVPVSRWIAFRSGMVAHPRNDRWHRGTIPLLGGLAIAGGMAIGSLITGVAVLIAVPIATAMFMSAVGLVDDVLALKPSTKLIAQIAAASVLVYFDYRLNWIDSRLLDSVLTMVWVIGLTNAFNLLDNMDGLCAGIALIVSVMMIVSLATGPAAERAGAQILFLALLAGATTGFLIYNFPPASIFMGDCGSLLLGFSLAMLTLGQEGVRGSRADVLSAIAGPVFVLLIPIFDTTLVTIARLAAGRSPAMGGRDHSSHRLVAIGLSERKAVAILWVLAAAGGLIAVLVRNLQDGRSLAVAALYIVAMGLFAVYLLRVRVYDETQINLTRVTPLFGEFMYKRRIVEVVTDGVLASAAFYIANRRLFPPEDYLRNSENFYQALPIAMAAQLIAFFIVGFYREQWQYRGRWREFLRLSWGVTLGATSALIFTIVILQYYPRSVAVFLLHAALLLGMITFARSVFFAIDRYVLRSAQP
jgi:UDP-GlcNAc:undecaprenyl-phosphate/decaprenyl-phosphate GlcNAc-1-phosphate transferase